MLRRRDFWLRTGSGLATRSKTEEGGALDFGFAADVKRALEYDDALLPALLFVRTPYISIYPQYKNVELLKLKNWPLNGVATTLGGRSVGAVRRFLEGLPRLLEGQNVPVDDLNKLLKSSASADKREKLAEGAKKVVVAGAEASVGLLTIISAYLKWTGTT
jgi:hypothetical protein